MPNRPTLRGCYGRSPKTGKKVGERHRWPNGWGKGRCEFCGKFLEDVLERPAPPVPADMPLDAVIERCVVPSRRLGEATPRPDHCVYPHCECNPPRWCLDLETAREA